MSTEPKLSLPPCSPEQMEILRALETHHHVLVNSVAGSGKTTSNLHIAKHFPHLQILLVTYNAKLKLETRARAKGLQMSDRIETHSYHSFCCKYYDHDHGHDDRGIQQSLEHHTVSDSPFQYDVIVVDEAQDMNPLYYHFTHKIYQDNAKHRARVGKHTSVPLVVVGDTKQSIFDFNGADSRFLSMANRMFSWSPEAKWISVQLNQSFRITHEMSLFLTHCMFGGDTSRIRSSKITGIKPKYIQFPTRDDYSHRIFDQVKFYLNHGYTPGDIFILAPSLKGEFSSVSFLERQIKNRLRHVPVFVPMADDAKLDEDILRGKLVFSSFHQSKGLERKIVFVYNFDASYFEFYKRDANPLICPNEIYVACTRALEHLILLHDPKNRPLPFLHTKLLETYCDVHGLPHLSADDAAKNKQRNRPTKILTPTELVSHVPQSVLNQCFDLLTVHKTCRPKGIHIPIEGKSKQYYPSYHPEEGEETTTAASSTSFTGYESVYDITGTAIPSCYELRIKGKMTIYDGLMAESKEKDGGRLCANVLPRLQRLDITNLSSQDVLFLGNLWNSRLYVHRQTQIKKYDWLSEDKLQHCMRRLDTLGISPRAQFEKSVGTFYQDTFNYSGNIDCMDPDTKRIFEFKCVQELTVGHALQLAQYMYLHQMSAMEDENVDVDEDEDASEYRYYLYNILSDEMWEIQADFSTLETIVRRLIQHKITPLPKISDETFLLSAHSV